MKEKLTKDKDSGGKLVYICLKEVYDKLKTIVKENIIIETIKANGKNLRFNP